MTIYYYKKLGRVVFGNSGFAANNPGNVIRVEYDPNEDGFSDTN